MFCSKWHICIISISKLDAAWLSLAGSLTEVSIRRADCQSYFFLDSKYNNTIVEGDKDTMGAAWLCCRRQMLFFRQKCDEESVGQTGWQTGGQTGGQTGWQTGGQTGGQTGWQTGWQTGGQKGGQTRWQTGGQKGRQTGGQTLHV